MDKLYIGIDFGNSTNFVTKYDFVRKDAVAVANMGSYAGSDIFDNVIYIEGDGKYILGKRNRMDDTLNFFDDVKRHITSDNQKWRVPNLGDRQVTASDIAEMIFTGIREKVEATHGGKKIDGAVITVPYAYGDKYRKRIKKSAENAGIPVIKLVEEPVAAAISFGVFGDEIENGKKENIVVFDFGGGTFDLTIFKFEKDDKQHAKIEVLNTGGVEKLGGKNIDAKIVNKFLEQDLKISLSDIQVEKEQKILKRELLKEARENKELLSEEDEVEIYKGGLSINNESKVIDRELSRDEFEDWLRTANIVGEIEDALDIAIADADLDPSDIDRVILAGGSSSIPIIKDIVRDFFGFEPEARKNLGELVGHGAGILAGLSVDDSLKYTVIRKTSKSVGVAIGNRFQKILRKNSPYGEISPEYKLRIGNSNLKEDFILSFYEGESGQIDECEKIGKATIDGTVFPSNTIFLSLYRDDDSGEIGYIFYDENKNEVLRGEFEEIEQ
ncbi:molecular chaperone [Thiovulum sp. ES]|nr:molecular chaperone [Thiovulum sp. ES]